MSCISLYLYVPSILVKHSCISLPTDGYAPSLGASIAFTIIFAISAIVFMVQTVRYRRWIGFGVCLALGTALESVGSGSRIMLHEDPFSDTGFKLSIILLTFSPAFLSASIYLLLKQICLTFSPELSRLRPAWYTYIFITCDVISILLQAAGGAISAIADSKSLLNVGVDIMIAGLAFQVITLLVFFLLAAEYFWKVRTHVSQLRSGSAALAQTLRFRLFLSAMLVAFICIFTRCCYRVGELSGGWGNPIMREQVEFIVLDAL